MTRHAKAFIFIAILLFSGSFSPSYAQKTGAFQHIYGASGNQQEASSVVALPDKGFMIAGVTQVSANIDTPVIHVPFDSISLTCEAIHAAMNSYKGSTSDTAAITAYLNSNFHINQTEAVYKKAFYQCKLPVADTMYFDKARYVDYGNNAQYKVGTGNFTLEAWVNSVQNNTLQTILANQDMLSVFPYYVFTGINLCLYNNDLYLILSDASTPPIGYISNGISAYTTMPSPQINAWHHVVVERTGMGKSWTDIKIWIDGISKTVQEDLNASRGNGNGTLTFANIDSVAVLNMKVGSRIGSFEPDCFEGSIREVRMYKRLLSQSEITRNYNNGCVTIPSDTTSLVLWAPLNDGIGYSCVDKSHYHAIGTVRDSGSRFWGSSSPYCYPNTTVISAPVDSIYLTCEAIHTAMTSYIGSTSDTAAITTYLNSNFHINQTESAYKKAFYKCRLTTVDTMYFDGKRYVDYGDNSQYHVGKGNFTIEAWVNPTLGSATETILANQVYSFPGYNKFVGFQFLVNGNNLFLSISDGGTPPAGYITEAMGSYVASPTLSLNTWHHVVVERTGTGKIYTDIKMWIDGVQYTVTASICSYCGNGTLKSANIDSAGVVSMKVGSALGTFSPDNLEGSIKQVRMYKRVLSNSEIVSNYNSGCVSEPLDTTGLVLWAPLNDGSGYFCVDESHYHATGTVRDSGSGFWGSPSSAGAYCYSTIPVIRARIDSINLTCDALHTAMSSYNGNISDTAAITAYLNYNFHIGQTEAVYKKAFYQCKISTGTVEKILIERTDSLGRQIWSKTYEGTGVGNNSIGLPGQNYLYTGVDMVLSPEGNVVVCSNTSGSQAVYLFKINQTGSVIWSKIFQGSNNTASTLGLYIINATGGGYLLTGASTAISTHGEALVIKTDTSGNVLWSNVYYRAGFQGAGIRITPSRDGGYLIGGVSMDNSVSTVFSYPGKYLIIKIDKNGKLLWSKVYSAFISSSIEYESANSIMELPDKSIYICGFGKVNSNSLGATLMKMDSAGNLLWSKIYNSPNVNNLSFRTGLYDSVKKNLNISCEFDGTSIGASYSGVIRLDTSGKIIFGKAFVPSSLSEIIYRAAGHDFLHLYTGDFVLIQSDYLSPAKGFNYYLVKMDSGANSNCNTSVFSISSSAYPLNYLYDYAGTIITHKVGSGCMVETIAVQDSAFCTSLTANFGWEYVCLGQKTQFLDSSFYQPTFWKWDFGDGTTSTLQNPVHQYSKNGPYVVKLVTGNGANMDSIIRTVNILQSPSSFSLDSVICLGDSILLNAKNPGATYLWNNGDTVLRKTVPPGSYWVKVSLGACSVTDSIRVIALNAIKINLGKDTTICEGDTLLLKAGYVGTKWSNGETGSAIKVSKSGKYWAVLKGSNCEVSDTIKVTVNVPLIANLGGNRSICDTIFILNPGQNTAAVYTWSNKDTGKSITVNTSGRYWVTISKNGCVASDTAVITLLKPEIFGANNLYDTVFCSDDSILTLDAGPAYKYLWVPGGNTTRQISITQSGTYTVQITGIDGCMASKTITITDDCSTPGFYVPNAFSPDSNGHNEVFKAYGVHIASFSMSIYNRWGEKLFSCNDINTGWDGKFKGDYCLNGMYVYDINYSTIESPDSIIKIKGTVYLMR